MHDALRAARARDRHILGFLRDLIRIRSLSCEEGPVIERIAAEMESVGFDEVRVDPLGNVVGRIGSGRHIIAMDAHVDTVDVNDAAAWDVPPFEGVLRDGRMFGRGAVDQKAGMAALVHAGGLLKDLGLEGDFTLLVVGSVQEEDCDGMCWQYLVREVGLRPECVVLTEPSRLRLHIGHRGRAEITLTTRGKAAHGSTPERGVNAVYRMGRILSEIEQLNTRLPVDAGVGKGSIAVTHISCGTPSLCSVPDQCTVHLDRRLTAADTPHSVMAEVLEAVGQAGEVAEVGIGEYDLPSYRGVRYRTRRFFPSWVLDASAPLLEISRRAFRRVFGCRPSIATWQFSTNGAATSGLLGIPTIGIGPGDERQAHAVNEHVPVDEVLAATAWYACFPSVYAEERAHFRGGQEGLPPDGNATPSVGRLFGEKEVPT